MEFSHEETHHVASDGTLLKTYLESDPDEVLEDGEETTYELSFFLDGEQQEYDAEFQTFRTYDLDEARREAAAWVREYE